MGRARNLKPGFFKNEDLAECSPWARLMFAGLWTLADREGRLEDRPRRIKGELFPYDEVDSDQLLSELASRGFIVRYTTDGVSVISIPSFLNHQRPHHTEKPSTLPKLNVSSQESHVLSPESNVRNPPSSLNPSSLNHESLEVKRKRFCPPTLDEVRSYCESRGKGVDPEAWYSHYQSNGWKVGKNAMKDWRAAIHTWEKNNFARGSPANRLGPGQLYDPNAKEPTF